MTGRSFLHIILLSLISLVWVTGVSSCKKEAKTTQINGTENKKENTTDTLKVGTLYSPTTYFIYRDEAMGYEYELAKQFAESEGMTIEMTVAPEFPALLKMLKSGQIDLIAARVPMTAEYNGEVRFCGPEDQTRQVLVQKAEGNGTSEFIDDVTELIGKYIYVEKDSKYYARLENLNEEIGGGIRIQVYEADSIVTRDLIEMVARGDIPYTISDNDIALLEKTYYPNIDVDLVVSLEQKSSWAVASDNAALAEKIDNWCRDIDSNKEVQSIHRRYFELSKSTTAETYGGSSGKRMIDASTISQYDGLFRKYADDINWDWRLLAAVGYEESRFDNSVTSWAGAAGVMQIMPGTAAANGLPASEIRNPERNIATSAKIFKTLDNMLLKSVPNPEERLKFVLAAYNAGIGHVYDAISLAEKYGKDKGAWEQNVREALLMKGRPEYYNDPVVRNGYFRANETVDYVDRVLLSYNYYKSHAPA